jgi:hypothetical protein
VILIDSLVDKKQGRGALDPPSATDGDADRRSSNAVSVGLDGRQRQAAESAFWVPPDPPWLPVDVRVYRIRINGAARHKGEVRKASSEPFGMCECAPCEYRVPSAVQYNL